MDNLTNGTEVLLFKNTTNDIYEDTKKYIKGIVIGSYTEASLLFTACVLCISSYHLIIINF